MNKKHAKSRVMIYIGLPQWSHPKWVRLGITSLEEYARHFNCVTQHF
ncbi:hypothetical protein RQI36_003282 [Escherichia coli]|nr:hypothetical protein [Escherichia coli]